VFCKKATEKLVYVLAAPAPEFPEIYFSDISGNR
jgi:hypothetical protein